MLFYAYLLAIAAAYVQMDVTVVRGNSKKDHGVGRGVEIHERDDNGIEIANLNTFFLANISLGSNNQSLGVLLDTGSSDLWVPVSSCDGLGYYKTKRGERQVKKVFGGLPAFPDTSGQFHDKAYYDTYDCLSFGYFSPNDLSTFQENTTALDFEISYLDGSLAEGYWGSDFVSFGDYRVNMTFGVATYSDSQAVFGIGLPENEVSNVVSSSYSGGLNNGFVYSNFPLRLKEEGLIKSHAYSMLLGRNNVSHGEILFGAVDHGKYDGLLQKVKIVNQYQSAGYKSFSIDVILDGILSDKFAHYDQTSVLLDSGATLLRLPYSYMSELVDYLDLSYSSSAGMYKIDCLYLDLDKTLSFYLSGVEIQVPLRDLVFQYHACYFGIRSSSSFNILGDNFLKNAYVVYDLENMEVALAQAAAEDHPETIEEISSLIPLALEAPYYSNTKLEEFYTTSDGYLDLVSQLVESPLYTFETVGRSSYDLGNTTYERYYTVSSSRYGNTYTETFTRILYRTTTTTVNGGTRRLAAGNFLYQLVVLAMMWI